MPRKQRFKPSRKPKPPLEETQSPAKEQTSSTAAEGGAELEPEPPAPGPHEVHPDDVESEEPARTDRG